MLVNTVDLLWARLMLLIGLRLPRSHCDYFRPISIVLVHREFQRNMDFLVAIARRANAASSVMSGMKSLADQASSSLVAVARRAAISDTWVCLIDC
jgi:hypothetical protein